MKTALMSVSIIASLFSISAIAAPAADETIQNDCHPRLVVHKVGPSSVLSGGEGTYHIRVTNISRCDANNVNVTDRLSAHTIFEHASDGGIFAGPDLGVYGGLVRWNNVNIEEGHHRTFEVHVRFRTDRPHIAIDTGCALVSEYQDRHAVPACESAETSITPDNDDWDRSLPVSRG